MKSITREEQLLQSISDGTSSGLSPITREEQYLSFIAGETSGYPQKPITRKEQFLEKIAQGGTSGGGAGVNVQPLNVNNNGTYTAPSGVAYSPVQVSVPSDNTVVDVDALPTENIDENAVYRIIGEEGVEAWYVAGAAFKGSLGDFFVAAGIPSPTIVYHLVDALPATLETSDLNTFGVFHIYVVSDTGVCYLTPDGETTMTLGTLLSNMTMNDVGDRGWADNITSIEGTDETIGVYAITTQATTTYGVSADANTNIYGYNGSSWDEFAVKESLLASANFTDYAELTGSADGIVMAGLSASSLTCLKIQGNVTAIGARACNEQGALKSIIVPTSVTSIGEYAFMDCPSLVSIIYNGTKEQWKAITFGTGWNNTKGDYIITCTDGTIAKDGTET